MNKFNKKQQTCPNRFKACLQIEMELVLVKFREVVCLVNGPWMTYCST